MKVGITWDIIKQDYVGKTAEAVELCALSIFCDYLSLLG